LLTEDLISLPLTSIVADQAATIYQLLKSKNQLIEMRDIFIAAMALVEDLPILTRNAKHFDRIPRLDLVKVS